MKFFVAICASIFLHAAYVDASDGASDNATGVTASDQKFEVTIQRKQGTHYELENFGLKITKTVGNISPGVFKWPNHVIGQCPPDCQVYYENKAHLKVYGLDSFHFTNKTCSKEEDMLKWRDIADRFSFATGWPNSSRICTYDCGESHNPRENIPYYMLGYFVADMDVDTASNIDDKDKYNKFSGMVFGVGIQRHTCALNLWVGSTYGKEGADPTLNNCISDRSPGSGVPRLRCRSGKNQIFTFQVDGSPGKHDQINWYPK